MSTTTDLFDRSTQVKAEYVLWEILKFLFPEFDDGLGKSTSTTLFLSCSRGEPVRAIGTMNILRDRIEITRVER